jgi:transposase
MIQIPAMRERCAAIDVGKQELAIALITGPTDEEGKLQTRIVGTTVPALEALKVWLIQEGCTSVAMESTGSYWIPVKNVLEGHMEIVLVSARTHQPRKGDKTDLRDAAHLAHLHRHALLQGSYLPERGIVELRDLTRRRKKLLGNLAAEKNRIQKILEVANVKIGNVVSDVFGVSGQEIVGALLQGKPVSLTEMARGRLRKKLPQLQETLQGHHLNDHHRWLIQQSVDHSVVLDQQLEQLEERIEIHLKPYQRQCDLLRTIPGFKGEHNAAGLLAEIGANMNQFPSARKLSQWAGVCPGNNRSAGKSKHSHIKKANKFLMATLVQAAWGAVRTQGSIFQRKYRRWQQRMGSRKALIAVCHALLVVAYEVLKQNRPYVEPDANQLEEQERNRRIRHHAAGLRKLGADETVIQDLVQRLSEPELIPVDDGAGAFTATAEEPQPVQVHDRVETEELPLAQTQPDLGKKGAKRQLQSPIALRGALGFRTRTRMHLHWNAKHDQPEATNTSAESIRAGPKKP